MIHVLRLNSQKQASEPFERAKVTADPEEVDFSESSLALRIVHSVPDALENGREWCHANTSTNKDGNLEFEDVFRGTAEWSIDVDSWENASQTWVNTIFVDALDDGAAVRTLVTFSLPFAAENSGELPGEIADHTHVDGDVVLLRGAGKREWVILP